MFALEVEHASKKELLAKVKLMSEILPAKINLIEFFCSFGFNPGDRVQMMILGILIEYAAKIIDICMYSLWHNPTTHLTELSERPDYRSDLFLKHKGRYALSL